MEVWVELQRRMSPGDKISAVFSLNQIVLAMGEAGERLAHPEAGEREIFLRAAARRLGRDLMIRVYGWDPEEQ